MAEEGADEPKLGGTKTAKMEEDKETHRQARPRAPVRSQIMKRRELSRRKALAGKDEKSFPDIYSPLSILWGTSKSYLRSEPKQTEVG